MTLDLYVDLRSQTLIQSHKNGGKFVVPRQYREQLIPLRMFYVSPNATGGAANPYTLEDSSAYTSVRVGIGGFDNPLAVSSAMTWNSAILGWEGGTLDLNTVEMSDAVDAANGGELSQIFETEAFHSGSLIKTQDSVVVKRTVLTSSGGLPNPVSNTNFANILELILVDSDTIDVERTGNEFQFHVRRKALGGIGADVDGIYTQRIGDAPAILSELATGFETTAPSGPGFAVTPSDDSVTATVGGVAGQCYKIKARVVGQVERKSISGGIQTPADNALAYRGGTPAANNFNLWYLEISDPAQVIHLNRIAGAETPPYTAYPDYFVDFLAYSGATVTLAFDTLDGLSYLANDLTVTQEMAEEVSSCGGPPEAHASTHEDGGTDEINVAGLSGLLADGQTALAHASTHASAGSDPLTLAQSQVTSLTSDLAAKMPLAGGTMTGQLNFSGTTHAGVKLLSLTTVQRDALTAANGMLIYNTTTATVQKYEAGAWVNSGTPAAHASTHQNGGADEISVAGLSGLLADGQTALAHASTHQNNGADEISVAGLSGLLADGQTALAHASTHQNNGADEISVAGLSGLLADGQTPLAHIASHAPGGSDALPWTTIHGRGTTGAKPAAAAGNAGYLYFDTTLAKLQRSTGSAWEDVAEPGAVTSYSLTATTTDATQTELLTAASARLTLPDYTAWGFTALFTGRYNGGYFTTWTARESVRGWESIASSSDGTKLAAVNNGGQLHTSSDSGVSWTARDSNRYWISIASSSDGTKLAAVVSAGQIYVSSDSGVSWTARDSNRVWISIASSDDGTKLAAAVGSGGQIYVSSDSGVTWTAQASGSRYWTSIASSSDGTKLAAVVSAGQIYVSSDSGVTWTARDSNRAWSSIASSDDGTKLAAGVLGGQIYVSSDSGVSWTARDSNRAWTSIASSDDGTKLAAVNFSGQVYVSSDSGVTWTARASDKNWNAIASSSDGTKLAAVVINGQIYTSADLNIPAASETCEFKGHAVRDSGAASMSISALQENPIGTNTAGRFVCQADTTNGALQFLATGAASEAWKWGVSIQTVEVTP